MPGSLTAQGWDAAETKVVTWDDLAFKPLSRVESEKHRILQNVDPWERISKKRTKNEAKTTKPDTEWKSVVKTKSRQSPSVG
ncbi:hypothetical protein Tco_1326528 [Tanacetum coccineum]